MSRRVARVLLPTAATGVLLASVAGCGPAGDDRGPGSAVSPPAPATTSPATTSPATTSPATTSPAAGTAAPDTFAVVGDSITAGGEVISDERVGGSASWVPAAAEASGLTFVGGWAVPGATTGDALAAVVPASADVVVIMAGTNDIVQGRPWEESAANLVRIAAAAGERVVAVATIAPSDLRPGARGAYNARLAQLAADRGWVLIDPWTDVASGDRFVPGTSTDGTHLTDQAGRLVGSRLGERLAALG